MELKLGASIIVRQHTHRFSGVLRMAGAVRVGLLFCWREDDAGSREMQQVKADKLQRAAGERAKGSVTRRAWVLVR